VRGLGRRAPTGVFFAEQSVPSLCAAVDTFEASAAAFMAAACRENALRFSVQRFRDEMAAFVAARWSEFARASAPPRPARAAGDPAVNRRPS
jgi:hypothetical protein